MGSLPQLDEPTDYQDGGLLPPLAIIGMSFRFPQDAVNASQFWNMMVEKRCASTPTPPDRFNVKAHYHPDRNQVESTSVRNAHFLDGDLAAWDAPFFNITAAEADAMDPGQRLTLEAAFRALENAGLPLDKVAGSKTSVYSATFMRDYDHIQNNDPDMQAKYRGIGTTPNMLSNRVSWFFDMRGPSGSVDTACSSSLLALDLVCQSIWSGDADMGLACGNNIMLTPYTTVSLDNLGLLGKDGRCFSFDHRGNGYARGEGVGVVVVKPVAAALRDGDTIRAVIRSTCSNQDGKTPAISQPSREAQLVLIRDAYAKAGLDLGATRYFEAHGTGTPVGDPIETGSIGAAFRTYRSPQDPLFVGSVKSNIGHLEGAAGVAGVIKAVIALEAGMIPPQTNFEKLNSAIDAEFLNIKIPTEPTPWPTQGLRRASVQSFGIGGANSHVVLDDAYNFLRQRGLVGHHNTVPIPPVQAQPLGEVLLDSGFRRRATGGTNGTYIDSTNGVSKAPAEIGAQLLVWSTSDDAGMKRVVSVWRDYFSKLQLPDHAISQYVQDLAYTLATRRTQFPHRSFSVAQDTNHVTSIADSISSHMKANPSPKLGFVFSGQGSQWHAMGRELLHRYPVYRNSVLGASVFLRGLGCPWDAIEELSRDEKDTNVNDAEFSQPLCTITQVALVDLLESFGVRPATVVGHSSGEIAAAYAAGALSKYAAWKIAYFRGLLASRLTAPETRSKTQGAMMAVGLSASEAKPYLQQVAAELGCERLVVACVNSPLNVTISGESAHIDHLKTMLDSAPGGAIFARKLRVEVAYHSFQMLEVADEYLQRIGQLHVPTISGHLPTMVSSVTGTWIPRADLANPEYWVRNLVSPVLFSDALATMAAAAGSTTSKPKLDGSHARAVALTELVEIGPHSVMQGPSREILRSIGKDSVIRYLSALVRKQSAISTVLDLAGRLHCLGHPVRLQQVNALQPSHLKASKPVISNKVLATLPEYPFNHAKSYWVESRLSKAYRFRKNNRHELVGAQAFDWNPLEARWRHFIRLSDMPWVEHHKINGTTLYPASGMLVMALEAVKQLADPEKLLTGFLFRDVTFHSALSLPDGGEAVEVNLHVRPRKDSSEKDAGWHDFRIYKYDPASRSGSGTEWQENCNGSIQLVYAEAPAENDQDELGTAKEVQAWKEDRLGRVARAKGVCTQKADPEQLYQQLAASGYNYGPTFQAIKDLTYDDNSMVATVQTYQWARHFEGHDPTTIMPHTVHPTTLDTILHTMLAVYTRGGTQKIATTIPTFVDRMWVSASGGLSAPGAEAVTVCTAGRRLGLRESESSIVVLDAGGKEVLIDVEGFQTTAVAADSVGDEAQQQAKPCYTVDWKPDLSLLSREEFQRFCHDSIPNPDPEPVEWCAELDLLLLATVKRTLTALQGKPVDSLEEYQRKYYDWMQHRMSSLDAQTLARLDDDALVSALAAKLATGNKQAQFYSAVAQDHVNLLADDKRALDLFFTGSLVGNYYSEAILAPCTSRLRAVVDAMAHNNPSLRFIEIGAGTGSMTDQLMKALNTRNNGEEPTTTPRYSRYTYTDLSPSFFSAAKHKYRDQGDRLQFKTLDITKDAETQGFEVGTYDVVVASGVLHATSDLATALKNSRKLLKPGGKLIILEPTMGDKGLRMNFAFGLLRDWWLSIEPNRKLSPCLEEAGWDTLFHQTGFSGNDVVMRDWQDDACHEFSIIVSTATETNPAPTATKEITIIHGDDAEQKTLAEKLQATFHRKVDISPLSAALNIPLEDETVLVFLLELGKPVWNTIEEPLFTKLQKILTANLNTKVLWVGQEGFEGPGSLGAPPAYRAIDGVSRVLNSEVDGEALSVLTLQTAAGIITKTHLDLITKVTARVCETPGGGLADTEFHEHKGRLCVPRLVRSAALSSAVARRLAPRQTVQRKWRAASQKDSSITALKLVLGTPGLLNTLHFVQDKERDAVVPLGPGEAEIEVRAVGLNYRDVLIALGRLSNANVGCECAGVVTRLGPGVEGIEVGDRVAALAPSGCYRSYLRVDHRFAARIPDSMPFHIAAAMLVNHLTAWSAFHDLARVAPGETVLVHSAAGGTGQAALQVARHLGAEIVATAGSADKKALLVERYGVSPDKIFSSRDPAAFARGVQRVTGGRGVDAVLNSLSGEGLKATWECVAPLGRFVEIGKRDIRARKSLPMARFEENLSFHAFDVGIVCKVRPSIIRPTLEKLFALYEQGVLEPAYPLQTYSVSELEKAFRIMQSGKTMGKIVIEMGPDDEVTAVLDTQPSTVLGPDASYVISGGLGGLGRSMATWLVDRGARNLILISRSGARDQRAKDFIQGLNERGVRVAAPVCDISDANALRAVLKECGHTMPPVRGAIQATMVLRDATFAGMTHEAWKAATAPKIQGSWNMHALLPADMDFFVGLSSAAGVAGGRGQANYAAGNTFIDALMRHRVSRGMSGATLDLGVFFNVGFMLESADLQARWKGREHLAVTEADLFALLDGYCTPHEADKVPFQAAVGIAGFVGDKSSEYYFRKPMLQTLALEDDNNRDDDSTGQQSAQRVDFASVFAKSTSLAEAAAAVNDAMLSKLAATLSLSREELDANTPLHTYGVDSLVAVELRNWFAKEVFADLAIFDILGGATTTTASTLAAGKTRLRKGAWGDATA